MLPPEAIRSSHGGNEVTESLRVASHDLRWQRECAGRNASERRASLENADAQADPMTLSGKADTTERMSDAVPPVAAPG